MNDPCFLDTNILMYAVGTEHPLNEPCLKILEAVSEGKIVAVTDTEVFQEVAYRYWSQGKWATAIEVLRDYESLFSEIYPIGRELLPSYYRLLSAHRFLSPRDAIHIAVMQARRLSCIYTADRDFEKLSFLEVLSP